MGIFVEIWPGEASWTRGGNIWSLLGLACPSLKEVNFAKDAFVERDVSDLDIHSVMMEIFCAHLDAVRVHELLTHELVQLKLIQSLALCQGVELKWKEWEAPEEKG
jgi:hypothetical protein